MIEFGIKDFIDIVLVAFILFYSYRLMKEMRSINVFLGILFFLVIWMLVSLVFKMRLLGSILDKLVSVGMIGLIVLFQAEIRHFLYNVGAHQRMRRFFFRFSDKKKESQNRTVMPIVKACKSMAQDKVGALIVFERGVSLENIVHGGDRIDALVTELLIKNVFFKNSPLHDGAMVIKDGRIQIAGCVLPVSHDAKIPKELGLRHRAALGITENTDALAIVVSEETGRISVAQNATFNLRVSTEQLERIITEALN